MKQAILILLFFFSLLSYTQENYNSENYKVTHNDIITRSYSKDSTANALVIYEQGNSYVDDEEYDLRTEVKHKIKILKKEGFNHANVTIYLYKSKSKKEEVKDITATTYNDINGKVVKTKLNTKDIYREEYNENFTLVKFTLPNIKEGSVITYSYKLISPYMFKYKGWEFQSDIPKLYSEYKASIPGNWLYHIKLVGGKKLTINDSEVKKNCLTMFNGASADCGNSIYAMKDIPAFIEEEYMTTKSNYLARIEYELKTFRGMDGTIQHYTKTWKDVDKEFRTDKEIGKQIRKKIDAEIILDSDILNLTDPLKKAQAIFKYVQNNFAWNGDYKIFKDVSVKNLLKNKSGNISSINILLHNLLRETNIDVKPILLSTRNNGFPTTIFPVISDFNYLIVEAKINDKTYLLDATDNYLSFGEIPLKCLNGQGRLLDFKNGSKWIDLKPNKHSSILYQAKLNLNDSNVLSGTINSKRTGYHALYRKKAYYKDKDEFLDKLENSQPNAEISNHEVTSNGKSSIDFKELYQIEYDFDDTDGNILFNPFVIKFFKENPFKLQERTYPIDFGYKDTFYYAFTLELNDNYEITEIPKNLSLSLPNNTGQVLFGANKLKNTLTLTFKIDFKEAIYPADYYPYLKEFMNKIVDIQNNTIIFLKKKK